jgi:hypothetical protein
VKYTPVRKLTCRFGVSYLFHREFSIVNEENNILKNLESENALGGGFSLAYAF